MVKQTDGDLLEGAKAIARDLNLPGGGKAKLAKVIDRHLDWFDAARQRGFEWSDIVRLLFKEGITRPDGRPLSRGHLSSLVWRKQAAQQGSAERGETVEAPVAERAKPETSKSTRAPEKRSPPDVAVKPPSPKSVAPLKGTAEDLPGAPARGSAAEGQSLLAYMRRAARLRGE